MIWRAWWMTRAGTQSSIRRTNLAWRRRGRCPGGSGPNIRSLSSASRFSASVEQCQPDAVGVQVRQRQAPEADAELGVLDAFLDLRAVAVVVLDRRGVAVEVGEDEAVAVDDVGLAGQPEVELLARDRALAPRPRVVGERVGLVRDAADDQPQRLVLPARGV